MKAVMYHYVRQADPRFPHFRYLHIDNFRKQLDYFEANGAFVTQDEWLRFVEAGEFPRNRSGHILTFDDAMSCHFFYIHKELRARNIWGIFYVPSAPYTGKHHILDVHKVHLLCGHYDGVTLIEKANSLIESQMVPFEKRDEFHASTYTRQTNNSGVTEFKRLMNYFLGEQYRTEILEKVVRELGFSFPPEDFYIPEKGLVEMSRTGMWLGSHTVNHPVMSKLSFKEQKSEIQESFKFLSTIATQPTKTYCHPYGGFHSFNAATLEILQAEGVRFSFNVEPRDIVQADHANMQHLPRFDCNQFPHGAAS